MESNGLRAAVAFTPVAHPSHRGHRVLAQAQPLAATVLFIAIQCPQSGGAGKGKTGDPVED